MKNIPHESIPVDRGYDARSRRKVGVPNSGNASGFLENASKERIYLWITDVTANFSVSGEIGQSRMLREWFPRSFNDVGITITGNAPSTRAYNEIASFVRTAQWTALQQINAGAEADQTIQFHLFNRKGWTGGKRNVKGQHRPWNVGGYVKTIEAGAVALEVAPEYKIEFIVANSLLSSGTGIWSDLLTTVTPLQTMLAILGTDEKLGKAQSGFVTNPVNPVSSRGGKYTGPDSSWSHGAGKKLFLGGEPGAD